VSSVIDSLFNRLSVRGLPPEHVPGLIREVYRIVTDSGFFTSAAVNSRLEQLGWGGQVLDESAFQLIVSLLETECGCWVRRCAVETNQACSSHYPSKRS
jgi:hypothetical protein